MIDIMVDLFVSSIDASTWLEQPTLAFNKQQCQNVGLQASRTYSKDLFINSR